MSIEVRDVWWQRAANLTRVFWFEITCGSRKKPREEVKERISSDTRITRVTREKPELTDNSSIEA